MNIVTHAYGLQRDTVSDISEKSIGSHWFFPIRCPCVLPIKWRGQMYSCHVKHLSLCFPTISSTHPVLMYDSHWPTLDNPRKYVKISPAQIKWTKTKFDSGLYLRNNVGSERKSSTKICRYIFIIVRLIQFGVSVIVVQVNRSVFYVSCCSVWERKGKQQIVSRGTSCGLFLTLFQTEQRKMMRDFLFRQFICRKYRSCVSLLIKTQLEILMMVAMVCRICMGNIDSQASTEWRSNIFFCVDRSVHGSWACGWKTSNIIIFWCRSSSIIPSIIARKEYSVTAGKYQLFWLRSQNQNLSIFYLSLFNSEMI